MRNKIVILTAIVVALVFCAGIAGVIIGMRLSSQPDVAGIKTQTAQQISPVSTQEASLTVSQSTESGQISESEQLVNSFYRWYINCLNQSGDCNYQNRQDLDYQVLTEKTRSVSGYDRLLCAQNIPDMFRIDHSTIDSPALESVYLVQSFKESQIQIIVEVEKRSDGPKIINVICPRP